MDYYFISWRDSKDTLTAQSNGSQTNDSQLIESLHGENRLNFNFSISHTTQDEALTAQASNDKVSLPDYLPNNLAWPIMSAKLREVIERNQTGKEHIDWLSCSVLVGDQKQEYYVLRFNSALDVIDKAKSKFVPGTDHLIKPVFSISKSLEFSIFHKPSFGNTWRISPGIYCNEQIMNECKAEGLQGIVFERVATSP